MEPTTDNGSIVRCERCGIEAPAGTPSCPQCHQWLPRNEVRLTSGIRRYEKKGTVPPDLAQSLDAFRDGVVSDEGGLENLTTITIGRIRVLTHCEGLCRLAMRELVAKGIDTAAGGRAYDRLLRAIDAWNRTAQLLGSNRVRVARDITELSASEYAEQQAGSTTGTSTAPAAAIPRHARYPHVLDVDPEDGGE